MLLNQKPSMVRPMAKNVRRFESVINGFPICCSVTISTRTLTLVSCQIHRDVTIITHEPEQTLRAEASVIQAVLPANDAAVSNTSICVASQLRYRLSQQAPTAISITTSLSVVRKPLLRHVNIGYSGQPEGLDTCAAVSEHRMRSSVDFHVLPI